jgi:RNA polymerase primary sigma factor
MTLEAIGEKYSLTKERIRQIKEKAIRKLRLITRMVYSH